MYTRYLECVGTRRVGMAGVKKKESAGNQHLRSVPEEEEELAQGWTGQKETRRAGATMARASRRRRLTMVKVAEN